MTTSLEVGEDDRPRARSTGVRIAEWIAAGLVRMQSIRLTRGGGAGALIPA
jgi:hypothetical protein